MQAHLARLEQAGRDAVIDSAVNHEVYGKALLGIPYEDNITPTDLIFRIPPLAAMPAAVGCRTIPRTP